MRKATYFILLASASFFVLASCGFQLRQAANLPAAMQRTYIANAGNDIQLARALRRDLTTPTTAVTENAATATAVLNILRVKRQQRVLSVSNTGQPVEYQVAYEVEFSLVTAGGRTLIDPQTLTLTRDYNYNVGSVIGDTEQANVLYKALVSDMVRLIVFRLEAVNRNANRTQKRK
jgi:LPS-assembly lipoprotein